MVSVAFGWLIKKAVGHVSKAIPLFGQAVTITQGLKQIADKHDESVRDRARELLKCNHIELCPKGWGTQVSDIIEWVKSKKGCAFVYDGAALCHFQASLQAGSLSANVYRWDAKESYVTSRPLSEPLTPCQVCSPAK